MDILTAIQGLKDGAISFVNIEWDRIVRNRPCRFVWIVTFRKDKDMIYTVPSVKYLDSGRIRTTFTQCQSFESMMRCMKRLNKIEKLTFYIG